MSQEENFSDHFKLPTFILKKTDTEDEDYAYICFIRRYRDHNKNTRYVFKSPEINAENVSNKFLKWLGDNYTKIDFDNLRKYNCGVPQETHEWTYLKDVPSWTYFLTLRREVPFLGAKRQVGDDSRQLLQSNR